ncbi:hypothetical protein DH09_17950 [Bacillaceae bacterium JMAK1]|nr:hypothetical protein DH09_17950 [Bacillaceae bacterium JMAK1]
MSSSEVKIRTEEKAADLIVEELLREGVECVFGIVSIHNMPMYDALLRSNKIKIVNARGESGAVNMADGYARSTGKLGVVLTSTGAGAGNAAGALTEAWNAGTPVLHLTGDVASAFVGTSKRYIHECKDQLKMMDGACKTAIAVSDPTNVQTVVREAIKQTKAQPTGPVTIQIPIDMQSKLVNRSIIQQEPQLNRGTFTLDSEVLSKIQLAERPVLWVGGGVVKASAHRLLTQFAEQIGAAVITSESGKGAIPEDHPQCIGNYAATKPTIDLLKSADLLISIGVRFRWNETGNYSIPIPDEHITINADALSINRNYDCQHALIGDAYDILDALTKQFEGETFIDKSSFLAEVTAVKVQVDRELREAMSPYGEIADHMRRVMPKNTIFVRDITLPAYQWGHRLIPIYEPRTSIHATGGGIGQSLPTAIGAQIGQPDQRCLVFAGDGGFMVNLGEMATAVEEKLPLVVVLFDDHGYGVLRNIQDATYGRRVAVDLHTPDFVQLAESIGFHATRVKTTDDFGEALENAIQKPGPTMVVVDMISIGPPAKAGGVSPAVAKEFEPK